MEPSNLESSLDNSFELVPVEKRKELLDHIYLNTLREAGKKLFRPKDQEDGGEYRCYWTNESNKSWIDQYIKLSDQLNELLHRPDPKVAMHFIRENGWILGAAKKVHLQSRVHDIPNVVGDFLKIVLENPGLFNSIHAYKVMIKHFDTEEDYGYNYLTHPNVVIYLNSESDENKVKQMLADGLDKYPKIPDSFTPRFNQRVGNIVFYSEGEGFTKAWLYRRGVIDRYYDPSTNYALVLEKPDHLPPSFLQRFFRRLRRN